MKFQVSIIFFSIGLFVLCPGSWAQEHAQLQESSSAQTYEELQQEIIRLKEADRVRDLAMKNLIRRIEQLERVVADSRSKKNNPQTSIADDAPQKQLSAEVKERMRRESEENYQLVQKAFEQRLTREGGMLLPPYQLVYEPSLSYAHASYDSIVVDGFTVYPVLVIGDIVAERVRRDIITNNHSFRFGLPWDMQIDLVIPAGYERKRSFRDDGTHVSNDTDGVGDISLGLSYQLVKGARFLPDTVVGVNWKSKSGDDPYAQADTDVPSIGTGFETWGLSLTSMTIADPMVIYGGVSAAYTLGDDKEIGHVQPGKSFGLNLGMALSLNLDTSLSFNYSYNYSLETEVDHQKIKGSDLTTSSFGIGLSRAKDDFLATDIDLAIGLTRDATDFQFTVSFPFEFSLADLWQ